MYTIWEAVTRGKPQTTQTKSLTPGGRQGRSLRDATKPQYTPENLGEHGRSTHQNSTRTWPQTLYTGRWSLVEARQADVKSGQVTVITSKDVPFEDQTAAWCLRGADSEHIQISPSENSSRNAIILLNYLYAWQLSKSNPLHRGSICPCCRYFGYMQTLKDNSQSSKIF